MPIICSLYKQIINLPRSALLEDQHLLLPLPPYRCQVPYMMPEFYRLLPQESNVQS